MVKDKTIASAAVELVPVVDDKEVKKRITKTVKKAEKGGNTTVKLKKTPDPDERGGKNKPLEVYATLRLGKDGGVTKGFAKAVEKYLLGGLTKGVLERLSKMSDEDIKKVKEASIANTEGARETIDHRTSKHIEEYKEKMKERKEFEQFRYDLWSTKKTDEGIKIFGHSSKQWSDAMEYMFTRNKKEWMYPRVFKTNTETGEVYTTREKSEEFESKKNAFNDIKNGFVGGLVGKIGGLILGLLKKFVSLVVGLFKRSFKSGMKIAMMPMKKIYGVVKSIFKSAIESSQILRSLHTMVITPLILLIEFLAMPMIPVVVTFMKNLLQFIMTNKDGLIQFGEKIAKFFEKALEFSSKLDSNEFFKNPAAYIVKIMEMITTSIREYVTTNKEHITSLLTDIFVSIADFAKESFVLAEQLIDVFTDALIKTIESDNFSNMVYAFTNVINTFFERLTELMTNEETKSMFADIAVTLVHTLVEFFKAAIDLGLGTIDKMTSYEMDTSNNTNDETREKILSGNATFSDVVDDFSNSVSGITNFIPAVGVFSNIIEMLSGLFHGGATNHTIGGAAANLVNNITNNNTYNLDNGTQVLTDTAVNLIQV